MKLKKLKPWCFLSTGNVLQAAFWYGLVVHFRIYPIIYALPIILVLDPRFLRSGLKPKLQNWSSSQVRTQSSNEVTDQYDLWTALKNVFTKERIMFGLVSGAVFLSCTGFFFYLYRWEFLHEALLYHLTRTDPRHNFSIYFYHIYLHYEHEFSMVEKLISFLPQFTVQLVLIFSYAQDLPFCFFMQTVAFVAFNKVCFSVNAVLRNFEISVLSTEYWTPKHRCFPGQFLWQTPLWSLLWCSLTGCDSAVLCVVLLLVAPDTAMEQHEAKVGRGKLYSCMDGCSTPLVDVGLFAGI